MADIYRIDFNFQFGQESYGCETHVVGEERWSEGHGCRMKVISIEEHRPQGEGERWFHDVKFEDGRMERIFNPNKVYFN